jgi:hypothetical protein
MTTIFRKSVIDKEKLRQIILKNPQSLMKGLSFIDLQLSTDECGLIDFLGVDTNGRMVLIGFDTGLNDNRIMELLSQMQWLKKNEGLIKRLFFSESVDFEQSVHMVLVAPEFSGKTLMASRQLDCKNIKLIQYNYIVTSADDAIIFDEVFSNFAAENAVKEVPVMIKHQVVEKEQHADFLDNSIVKQQKQEGAKQKAAVEYEMATLTPEEIAEFMSFEISQEQNQVSE